MKCLYINNPYSGKKEKHNDKILERLREKYDVVDFAETKYRAHLTEIVDKCYQNYDTIVVTGGDGTLNETVNALAEKGNVPNIGYIPSGTCNDVARSLGIPKNVDKALDIILNGKEFAYDIMKVNDRYCLYVCGIGIFTSSSYDTKQKAKRKIGKTAYYFHGIKDALVGKNFMVDIKSEELNYEGTGSLLLFINSKSVAGFNFNKQAILDDGYVDVCLIHEKKFRKRVSFINKLRILKVFLFGFKSMKNNGHVKVARLNSASVLNCENVNQDGECVDCANFSLKIVHKGVKIIC